MVPMSEGTARALSHYMNRVRPQTDCDYVFLTLGGGKGLKPSALSAIFQRINAKVPFRAHAHALRHTYATNYARDVGDANLLQQNLGHRTPKVTQRYLHWAAEDLGRGIDKMRQF
jgi:integrase/recombinase XerC/integrase/recombinase XerD